MQAHNPSHAAALVVVDELARNGVTDAVLAPGSRSTALAIALHDEPRIRLHVEIDERSAGYLAIGLGRATGRPAVVVVTSGTAGVNLHPAVVEADTGDVPLLVVTADRPAELRDTGANQAIDQFHLFGRSPRWFHELGVAEDRPGMVAYWRSVVARAVAATCGVDSPPGPVHLNAPFREPTVPASDDGRTTAAAFSFPLDGRTEEAPWARVDRAARQVDADVARQLAARIAAAPRGLVVAGTGTASADVLHTFSRATGYPLLAEPTSNARGPGAISHTHQLLGHQQFAAAHRPELVIRVGRPGLSRHLSALLPAEVPQILIDGDGGWHDPDRAIGEFVVADPDHALRAIAGHLDQRSSPSTWAQQWQAADAAASRAIDAVLDADDAPSEPRLARDLGRVLPSGSTLVVGSSMPVRDLDQFLAARTGLRLISNRGASGIDGVVSTALGVAIANTAGADGAHTGPTVALVGDLTFLHDAAGLLLAPDVPRLDLTFVVIDNDGGGIFSFLPQAAFPDSFERVFGTPHGRDLAHLAAFHDLAYHQLALAGDLGPLLEQTSADGGLHLVHVRTDRAANHALHGRLTETVHGALDEFVGRR